MASPSHLSALSSHVLGRTPLRRAAAICTCWVAIAAQAQPNPAGFVPGHVFFSARGACGDGFDSALFELDPETGERWLWKTHLDGLICPDGLRFTPDGRYLRILDFGASRIWDMDAQGNLILRYSVLAPAGGNGLIWDRQGTFYCTVNVSGQLFYFPGDQLPGFGGPAMSAGGLARTRSGRLLAANGWLKEFTTSSLTLLQQFGPIGGAKSIVIDRSNNWYVATSEQPLGRLYKYPNGNLATPQLLATNYQRGGYITLALSPDQNTLYVGSSTIYAMDPNTGAVQESWPEVPHPHPDLFYRMPVGMAVYDPPKPGDLNCDGFIDNFDIDPFLLALTGDADYELRYFFCDANLADVNQDGQADLFDIDPFIQRLIHEAP